MRRRRSAATLGAAVGLAAAMAVSGLAGADSFTPVRLTVKVASVARRQTKLPITVSIAADAGALDSSAPLRLRVKLAPECGGSFALTPGTVLLDKALSPQPATGQAYAATLRGSGRPGTYSLQTVCVFVEEQGDSREFATDQSVQVNVSKPCTLAAHRYDQAQAALGRARRRHLGVSAAQRLAASDKRTARKRCGPGVPV